MKRSSICLTVKENVEFLVARHNLSEAELCRKTNIPQATLHRLLKGTTDDPRASTLQAIARFFNITVDQLLGNHPLLKDESKINAQVEGGSIPIFSFEKAEEMVGSIGQIQGDNYADWVEVESSINTTCFAIRVKGDSMWPQLIEGMFVIVDPNIAPNNRDLVLYFIKSENRLILRQYIEEGAEKLLKPANFGYKTLPIGEYDKLIGVVIQSRNDFKK